MHKERKLEENVLTGFGDELVVFHSRVPYRDRVIRFVKLQQFTPLLRRNYRISEKPTFVIKYVETPRILISLLILQLQN